MRWQLTVRPGALVVGYFLAPGCRDWEAEVRACIACRLRCREPPDFLELKHARLDNLTYLIHTVGVMAKGDNLGEFEQLILAALVMLGDNAYGMTIHEQVEKLAAGVRTVSLGSCYTTLDRLEQKGYVKSWFSDPTPERGGRSKRFFEITGSGELTLKNSIKLAGNVLAGLREIGGLA
jgi:PadR family transcriptional regulator PadR